MAGRGTFSPINVTDRKQTGVHVTSKCAARQNNFYWKKKLGYVYLSALHIFR